MKFNEYINENNKYIKFLLFAAVVVTAGSTVISFINSYPNWRKPKIKIKEVNFENGNAKVEINDREMELIGDSVLTAGGNWGVKFGYASTTDDYETIELTKNGMVYDVVAKRDDVPLSEQIMPEHNYYSLV